MALAFAHEIHLRGDGLRVRKCTMNECGAPATHTVVYVYERGRVQHAACPQHAAGFAERHNLILPRMEDSE